MTTLLFVLALVFAGLALLFFKALHIAEAQRDNARSDASHWQAVAAQRLVQVIEWRHQAEMLEAEQRFLSDLFAPHQHVEHSPATVSPAEIEALIEEPVTWDDEGSEGV